MFQSFQTHPISILQDHSSRLLSKMKSFIIAALLPLIQSAAYIIPTSSSKTVSPPANNRRALLQQSIAGLAAALTLPRSATASDLQDVYFGAGCFWHVQHEFVLAERNVLNRKDSELTSRTGYAGGFKTDDEGRVCYHNFQGVADYGKLGHGEVVGMTIPEDKVGDFAVEYFKLFGDKGGEMMMCMHSNAILMQLRRDIS
jgi:hypothetical protein